MTVRNAIGCGALIVLIGTAVITSLFAAAVLGWGQP